MNLQPAGQCGPNVQLHRVAVPTQLAVEEVFLAKQGKRTPGHIERFVVNTKRNGPGLTQRQIADKVEEQFGEGAKIDKSTIGRVLKRASGNEASNSESRAELGPPSPYRDLHQQDLLAEVDRLREVLREGLRGSLQPPEGLQSRVHLALREHIQGLKLGVLLDGHREAYCEHSKVRDQLAGQLRDSLRTLAAKLPVGVDIYPWDQQVLYSIEQRLRSTRPGQGIPGEHRIYDPNPDQFSPDRPFIPNWGGFNLTRSPVVSAQYKVVYETHQQLREFAEGFLAELRASKEKLDQAAGGLAEALEEIILRRQVPGDCSYCPGESR